MKKLMIFTLLLSLIFGGSLFIHSHTVSAYEDESLSDVKKDSIIESSISYVEGYDESSSYYGVYAAWQDVDGTLPTKTYDITYEHIVGGVEIPSNESFGYPTHVVKAEPNESISFDVTVTEDGLYELYFDYYLLSQTKLRPAVSILVNEETQYNELANIEVPIKWAVDTTPVYDRFGDELTPNSVLYSEWNTFTLQDPNFFFIEPMKIYLPQGSNTITVFVNEGFFLFGDITVGNVYEEPLSYSEYLNEHTGSSVENAIEIAAERYSYESEQNIRSKFVRNPSLTPYSYKNRVLNVLDQSAYRESGDSVTYIFDVAESGYYNLTIKYMQSENDELDSQRAILIDGEIPFAELESYPFEFSRKWVNETLHDDEGNFEIYLEAGTHELTLLANNKKLRDVYHNLLSILDDIDAIARDVNKITGGLSDRYRDYKLDVYIPTISSDLERLKEELINEKSQIIELYGTDDLSIISEINLCLKYFDQFIENPDEIPPFQYRFNEGTGSIYAKINVILPRLIDNPLQMDSLIFHNEDYKLAKANVNIFVRSWESVRAFFYSFVDPKYNEETEVDDDTVVVWVRQSRLYIQVMQRMIDEGYTEDTGNKVQLSVMPDETKIVLANAANRTPDAAMGLSVTRPFEFAIRGMVTDLSELDGFYDLTSDFNQNSFIPYVYEGGVYSIPETMDVKLLFYRTDILEFLGVEPPETWEEVVSLIPVMQRFNYYFYTPLGGDNAFKTFGETTPFIYQHYGSIYNATGDKTVLNEEGSYEAFEFMTDLFSVYNVPITTSNFFQKFRDGLVPIGIGDGNTYIQLKYAAPELAGQWAVMPIPGVEYDKDETECPGPLTDGRCIERWDPTYGTSSVIFEDSDKKDLSWEYFKWWFSSDVQSEFTYQLQSLLGDEFLHMTANVEAFKTSAWPSDSKYEILEQWEWIRQIGKVPGDYLVERELSNAWNTVVNDGTNPRVAIDDAVVIINRELKRKLTEFGYYVDGELVKPFIVPTNENIHLWMTEEGDDDE